MKKILAMISILYFFAPIALLPQNYNAVCAGINDYPGSDSDLDWCVNDVTYMRQYLINYKQWNNNNISRLTDGDAEESEIQSAMQNMPTSTGNTNLFHFSGHGDSQELGGTDGLIPSNSLTARINQSELQTNFGSTFNQCTAFLDACGTGIFPRDMSIGVITSACEADELASESGSIEHGYYTYYLLQGLAQSNIITAEHLYNYAAPLTTQASPPQHPQIGDNFTGDLFLQNTISGTVTFSNALTIPSGTTITVASGANITFSGNYSLTVNSGGSLVVNQGATLTFTTGSLTVNGTITANGTSGTINFNSAGASKWGGIQLGTTASSSSVIKYCNITNANQGIYVGMTNSSGNFPTIEYNAISSCNDGIYLYNSEGSTIKPLQYNTVTNSINGIRFEGLAGYSNYVWIYDNILTDNDCGLVIRYAHPRVFRNKAECNNYGVKVENYSYPKFAGTVLNSSGLNRFANNGNTNVYTNNNVNVWMGELNEVDEGRYGGYNTLGSYDDSQGWLNLFINANSYSTVMANYSYFGTYPPVSAKIVVDGTSSVDYTAYLSSDPTTTTGCASSLAASSVNNPGVSLSKVTSSIENINSTIDTSKIKTGGFATKGVKQNIPSLLYYFGLHHYMQNKFDAAADVFYNIINNYPDSLESIFALNMLARTLYEKDIDTLSDFLSKFETKFGLNANKKSYALYEAGLPLLAGCMIKENNINAALNIFDKIIDKFPGGENAKYSLYNKLAYYINVENDKQKAAELYKELATEFPKDPILVDALILIGEDPSEMLNVVQSAKRELLQKRNSELLETDNIEIKDFALEQNYPNPFNPVTTIQYQIPTNGKVQLKVYDLLGKEVAELVNKEQTKGIYRIKFDINTGVNLTSGVYFYLIEVNGSDGKYFRDSKKLIILK